MQIIRIFKIKTIKFYTKILICIILIIFNLFGLRSNFSLANFLSCKCNKPSKKFLLLYQVPTSQIYRGIGTNKTYKTVDVKLNILMIILGNTINTVLRHYTCICQINSVEKTKKKQKINCNTLCTNIKKLQSISSFKKLPPLTMCLNTVLF